MSRRDHNRRPSNYSANTRPVSPLPYNRRKDGRPGHEKTVAGNQSLPRQKFARKYTEDFEDTN